MLEGGGVLQLDIYPTFNLYPTMLVTYARLCEAYFGIIVTKIVSAETINSRTGVEAPTNFT